MTSRADYPAPVNRAALEARVLERLRTHAAYDPLAWLPVVGSIRHDGVRHGIAVELFGAEPRRSQLESLERALFQLARERQIEVAQFAAPPTDGGPMPRQPRRHDDQTYLGMALTPGSAGPSFAVRLARERESHTNVR
jgi:hypothetical protein